MGGAGMTKLSLTDRSFLMVETRMAPMHVGGVCIFKLPKRYRGDFFSDLMEGFNTGHRIEPPFNQILSNPYRRFGTQSWNTDKNFDLDYHLRHLALPRPGTMRQLNRLISRLHGIMLDRNRPLWEFYVIEGLEGSRFAVYFKIHHAVIDGASGIKLLFSSFRPSAEDRMIRPMWQGDMKHWQKQHHPENVWAQIEKAPAKLANQMKSAMELGRHAGKIGIISKLLGDDTIPFVSSAPKTMFNQPISGQRRFECHTIPIKSILALSKITDSTVNDIVLAICSGALRRYLENRIDLPHSSLLAMIPIALPAKEDGNFSANRVTSVTCNLATNLGKPLERLAKIKASMNKNKELLEPLSGTSMENVVFINQGILPFANAIRPLARYNPQSSNLTISNVPGPRKPFFLNGAQLESTFPVSIILHGQALNITVVSYFDKVCFGLLGCRELIPDLDEIAVHMGEAFEELEAAVSDKSGEIYRLFSAEP